MTIQLAPNWSLGHNLAAVVGQLAPALPMTPEADPDVHRLSTAVAHVTEAIVKRTLGLPKAFPIDEPMYVGSEDSDYSVLYPWALAWHVTPYVARIVLKEVGWDVRIVAGRASWSATPGGSNRLDRGVGNRTRNLADDVALGRYHVWVKSEGRLLDFAARYLPLKFQQLHDQKPFSTPPAQWHRFPAVIDHNLRRPIPNPGHGVGEACCYRAGQAELLECAAENLRQALPLLAPLFVTD